MAQDDLRGLVQHRLLHHDARVHTCGADASLADLASLQDAVGLVEVNRPELLVVEVGNLVLHQVHDIATVEDLQTLLHLLGTDTLSELKGGEQCDGFRLTDPLDL